MAKKIYTFPILIKAYLQVMASFVLLWGLFLHIRKIFAYENTTTSCNYMTEHNWILLKVLLYLSFSGFYILIIIGLFSRYTENMLTEGQKAFRI